MVARMRCPGPSPRTRSRRVVLALAACACALLAGCDGRAEPTPDHGDAPASDAATEQQPLRTQGGGAPEPVASEEPSPATPVAPPVRSGADLVGGAGAVPGAEPDAEPPADAFSREALEAAGWTVGAGHRGLHLLAWRLLDREDVPRNVDFSIEVLLVRDGAPAVGPRLALSGWMPEHEHGMVRLPVVEDLGDGRFGISALLLHMRGAWQLRFQVQAGRDTEIVTFDLEV